MTDVHAREIVTPTRPLGVPLGERILRDVAAEYGITVADIRARWNGHRRYGPAKVEAARRLTSAGITVTVAARIMRRDHTTVMAYLGRHGYRSIRHTPESSPLGPRQARYLSVLTRQWMTSREIADRLGVEWYAEMASQVSRVCHMLLEMGLIEKGGMAMKPMWRRVR